MGHVRNGLSVGRALLFSPLSVRHKRARRRFRPRKRAPRIQLRCPPHPPAGATSGRVMSSSFSLSSTAPAVAIFAAVAEQVDKWRWDPRPRKPGKRGHRHWQEYVDYVTRRQQGRHELHTIVKGIRPSWRFTTRDSLKCSAKRETYYQRRCTHRRDVLQSFRESACAFEHT